MWTAGDELPKGYTDLDKADDDNICCMCTGSGIQRDIDPDDNHALIIFRIGIKCPKCTSRLVTGCDGVFNDMNASCETWCDDCDFSWTSTFSKEWEVSK